MLTFAALTTDIKEEINRLPEKNWFAGKSLKIDDFPFLLDLKSSSEVLFFYDQNSTDSWAHNIPDDDMLYNDFDHKT